MNKLEVMVPRRSLSQSQSFFAIPPYTSFTMQSSTFILATILGTLTLSQAQGGFYSSCDPTTFNYQKNYTGVLGFAVTIHGWLSGECQGSDGTYTNSTLDLSVCLTNNNGNLTVSGILHRDA